MTEARREEAAGAVGGAGQVALVRAAVTATVV